MNESEMENQIRNAVLNRFYRAGWITGSWIKEASPQSFSIKVEYTPLGKEKMRAMSELYEALDYNSGARLGGEFEFLQQLIWSFHSQNPTSPPPDPGSPSGLGRT